jgi:hypothetical protein
MANGTKAPPLSAAGSQLFAGTGLGDLLSQQVGETAEELRKRRLAEMQGRSLGTDLGYGSASLVGAPLNGFGRLR